MRRIAPILLCVALLWPAVAVRAVPAEPVLTDEEIALLEAGEMVVRNGYDDVAWKVLGVIDIDAPRAEVMEKAMDFDARLAENKPAKAYNIYKETTEGSTKHVYATWELKVVGIDIVYSNHYAWDVPNTYMTFTLDPDMESDLVVCDGVYHLVDSPAIEGGTRFYYIIETDSGRKMPESIRVMFAEKGLKGMLKGMKKRAEE